MRPSDTRALHLPWQPGPQLKGLLEMNRPYEPRCQLIKPTINSFPPRRGIALDLRLIRSYPQICCLDSILLKHIQSNKPSLAYFYSHGFLGQKRRSQKSKLVDFLGNTTPSICSDGCRGFNDISFNLTEAPNSREEKATQRLATTSKNVQLIFTSRITSSMAALSSRSFVQPLQIYSVGVYTRCREPVIIDTL
jgi:hypothetical protein